MKLLRGLLKSPGFVLGMVLFIGTLLLAFLAPLLMHIDPRTRVGLAYLPPSSEHWLGTDHMGVDMLSMLIAGLQSSLYVGFLAGTVATVVGTLIGVYGGYKGGLLDDLLTVRSGRDRDSVPLVQDLGDGCDRDACLTGDVADGHALRGTHGETLPV